MLKFPLSTSDFSIRVPTFPVAYCLVSDDFVETLHNEAEAYPCKSNILKLA